MKKKPLNILYEIICFRESCLGNFLSYHTNLPWNNYCARYKSVPVYADYIMCVPVVFFNLLWRNIYYIPYLILGRWANCFKFTQLKRRGMYRVRRLFFFLVNRVEHQNRTQTANTWWPFRFVFDVQLGLRHKQALINI